MNDARPPNYKVQLRMVSFLSIEAENRITKMMPNGDGDGEKCSLPLVVLIQTAP